MTANYYRVSLRLKNAETARKLSILQRSLEKETGKKLSKSSLIEGILEQFLDKNILLEENEKNSLAIKKK